MAFDGNPGWKNYMKPKLRFSITGSAGRHGLDTCHPQPMSKDTMQDYWQHERFGVHY